VIVIRHALSLPLLKERIDNPGFYNKAAQFLADLRQLLALATRVQDV
jgi:hypothetical protein